MDREKLANALKIVGGLIAFALLYALGFWLDLKYMELKLWLLGR